MSEYSGSFEIIARAVIMQDGKIVLCRGKGKDYYFFPGGHVERGEKAEEALVRELNEEAGIEVGKISFIGTVENIFRDSYVHHEINIVFQTGAFASDFKSREDHIDFEMLSMSDFGKAKVLPLSLKEAVLNWIDGRRIFWKSEG